MNVFEKLKISPPTPRKADHVGTGSSAATEKTDNNTVTGSIVRSPDGKFTPGKSANPQGRPKGLSYAELRSKLQDPDKMERFWSRMERIIEFGSDKDSQKAFELWMAYGFGKPVQPTEISGHGGAPIQSESKSVTATVRVQDPDRMRKLAEGFLKTLPPPKPSILLESASRAGSASQAATEERTESELEP